MKTIIKGKVLTTTYSVNDCIGKKIVKDENGNDEDIMLYMNKPTLEKETKIAEWKTLAELDGEIEYNSSSSSIWHIGEQINLSEDEVVNVTERITRVDLGAYVLHTDKVVEENIVDKEESEIALKEHIKAYNKQMIESNDRLLSYCKIHNISINELDDPDYVDNLTQIVYPDSSCMAIGGTIETNKVYPNTLCCAENFGAVIQNGSLYGF